MPLDADREGGRRIQAAHDDALLKIELTDSWGVAGRLAARLKANQYAA